MSFLKLVHGGKLKTEDGRLDDLTTRMLSQHGFLGIARKVVLSEPLDGSDVLHLFRSASLPILMKLVSLRPNKTELREPRPTLVLPWSFFLSNHDLDEALQMSVSFLQHLPHPELEFVFDYFDVDALDQGFSEVLLKLTQARPGITLIGPKPEEIVSWIARRGLAKTDEQCLTQLQRIFELCKASGIRRLRSSEFKPGLKLAHEVGLRVSLNTDIASFKNYEELTDEFETVRELAAEIGLEVWGAFASKAKNSVLTFNAVRALGIGALLFDKIKYIRAPTSFFPEECLPLAFYCGANDFGTGAIDAPTQQLLNLKPIAKIKRSIELIQALRT